MPAPWSDPPAVAVDLGLRVRSAVRASPRVLETATLFGLGIDQAQTLEILPPTRLTLRPRELVFLTGPSGSGKSSVLRQVRAAALAQGAEVFEPDAPEAPEAPEFAPDNASSDAPPDVPLVDAMGDAPLDTVLGWLALAGLADAFVMLRTPSELSDGQRKRFDLARAFARLQQHLERPKAPAITPLFLADEFGATLDRTTAMGLARAARKLSRQTPACFVLATSHDDLLEPLDPDVLLDKGLGSELHLLQRAAPPPSRPA
ncbi:MAG: AAA family ATPase [Planctomycetota bacterium]